MELEKLASRALGQPPMVLLVDGQGTVLQANEQASTMLGEPIERLVGRRLGGLLADEEGAMPELTQALSQGKPWAGGVVWGAEGKARWMNLAAVPCPDGQGRAMVVGIAAREALDAVAGLRDALDFYENSPCALHSLDPQGVIVKVNHTWLAWMGYEREEVEGKLHFEDILAPESVSFFRSTFSVFQAKGILRDAEFILRRRDGTTFPVLLSATMVRDEHGQFVRTRSVMVDITERKRIEAANARLNERLLDAIECIQDPFAIYDADDRLVQYNSAFRRTLPPSLQDNPLGVAFTEVIEHKLQAGMFVLGDESYEAYWQRRMGYRKSPVGSFEARTTDGRVYRIFERRTTEGGTVTVLWDITDDVKREEELRQAQREADAANAAKSEFLSSMSHELRTPLNAILGFTQLLQRDKKTPLSERQQERVAHVLKAGEHLLRLIDEVLDLSRIERGTVQMSPEPVAVPPVLDEVVTTLLTMARGRGVALALAPLPPGLPGVCVDRTRFSQILLNLGSNAIKYNRPDGTVTLTAETTAQGAVRVTVSDTGIGIPAERQSDLFHAFQRLGQETGPIEGTGIGLVITKRLAEQMGGTVGFRSTPGKGSDFWVEFPPLAMSPPVSLKAVSTPIPVSAIGRAHTTVLYVEDNPANVALMRELLTTLDHYKLLTAPTAELGLELARVHRPDIIVLDINLPGMSGLAAIEHLRTMDETRSTPVLALSASAMPRDASRALAVGFNAYLTKPVKIDALLDAFERWGPVKN